ncbi:conserved Plasmodium protein, unknown function [Plasmodium ovale wallikeri]|uniref:RIIa domain-containing protein n=1 Tax=Plasmodium ovale wallikeri TaxID=864142 RepID=A0A1A8ZN76_PLAOA|nr:conserved Plasmodium protein, unknown function [Plasmodium ovale wallikeri]SBT45952.1 conserved Plasmodium protein, unknown function [Plasmodium ovale wallikeri]
MNRLSTSDEDYRKYVEDKLKEETEGKFIKFPTSQNAHTTLFSPDFGNIEPNYFLTNNLKKNSTDSTGERITFEQAHDEQKEEKKKIFLFDLSEGQKEKVEKYKINKIVQNEMYLKKKKTLKYIIQIFLYDLLKNKPDNVYEYTANYFTQPNLKINMLNKLRSMLNRG